jgi:hypothetical protein
VAAALAELLALVAWVVAVDALDAAFVSDVAALLAEVEAADALLDALVA